jgi:hypothetical protein
MSIKIKRLRFDDVPSAGCQIKAFIDQPVPCVEFTMKGNQEQPVMLKCSEPLLTATEPWLQFAPKVWDEMISELFQQMVDAWNEKYAAAPGGAEEEHF